MDKDALEAIRCRAHLPLRQTRENDMTLQTKKIVVLGGSSGIGLAVAQAAAREGANLTIVSSNPGKLETARQTLPAGTAGEVADLAVEMQSAPCS